MTNEEFYAELKRLDAENGIADPAESATAANAASTTLEDQAFKWGDAKDTARRNGDWPKVVVRSRQVPTIPAGSQEDNAILAAVDVVESRDADLIDPASAVWQADVAALTAVGDISGPTATALSTLTTVEVPVLDRVATADDVLFARGQV